MYTVGPRHAARHSEIRYPLYSSLHPLIAYRAKCRKSRTKICFNWTNAAVDERLPQVLVLGLETFLELIPISFIDGAFESFRTRIPALQPLILDSDSEHSFVFFKTQVSQPARYFLNV